MKGSSWENFQSSKDGIYSLWKNDKRKGRQKAEFEKVRFRRLEGREIRGQLSRDTPKWKINKRLLGKKHQKKKIMRNKEGPATKVASTTLALVHRGANERNQW